MWWLQATSLLEAIPADDIDAHLKDLRAPIAGRPIIKDDNTCQACGGTRLTFEPPILYCSACEQRIKRNHVSPLLACCCSFVEELRAVILYCSAFEQRIKRNQMSPACLMRWPSCSVESAHLGVNVSLAFGRDEGLFPSLEGRLPASCLSRVRWDCAHQLSIFLSAVFMHPATMNAVGYLPSPGMTHPGVYRLCKQLQAACSP